MLYNADRPTSHSQYLSQSAPSDRLFSFFVGLDPHLKELGSPLLFHSFGTSSFPFTFFDGHEAPLSLKQS
jgi:hypothetical protein